MAEERHFSKSYLKAKGADRIQINNILSAISLGAISFLITLTKRTLSPWLLEQMAFAIPCLVTSSLAYSKIAYRPEKEIKFWDALGWLTHSLGYIFLVNSIALMLQTAGIPNLAFGFIGCTIFLFVFYSALDMIVGTHRVREKIFKLVFYFSLIALGSVLPILMGSV